MQGDSLSEETDSHEEESQEWRGSKVEREESEQEGVVNTQSEISFDDRVVRTEGEEGPAESDEKLQQTNEIHQDLESEQHQGSGDVSDETKGEPPDDPEMDGPVKGPSRSNSPQQEQVSAPPSQPDRSVTKASIGHTQGEKGSETIPDLTRRPVEEEEGDGERPSCV